MKRVYLVGIFGFLFGYGANDLKHYTGLSYFNKAEAQSGIDWRSISRDKEFRHAVLRAVDGNCHVDSGQVYC